MKAATATSLRRLLAATALSVAGSAPSVNGAAENDAAAPLFNDAHFHLTNYVQRGPSAREFLAMAGARVGRAAIFGIPLQQKWDWFVSGDRAPDYYLRSAAALYYYSFVDAAIAAEYLALTEAEQARLDPMITGFNPTDMYAADHIRRVLRSFPGVFAGIGEFTVHKEFVSSKVAGHAASLRNPALDRILDAAAETGLVVILHCDVDNVRPGSPPDHATDLTALFARHPGAAIVWAHAGLGRFVAPAADHVERLAGMFEDPRLAHVHVDISWDEVARHLVRDDASADAWARLVTDHPERFLFGTDSVAPTDWASYSATYAAYEPLWQRLSPETLERVLRGNYTRLFDAANARVRAWEREHAGSGREAR